MNIKEFIRYVKEAKRVREAAMDVGKPALNKEFTEPRKVSVAKDQPRKNDIRKTSQKIAPKPELGTRKDQHPTANVGKPDLNIAFQGRRSVAVAKESAPKVSKQAPAHIAHVGAAKQKPAQAEVGKPEKNFNDPQWVKVNVSQMKEGDELLASILEGLGLPAKDTAVESASPKVNRRRWVA